MPQAINPTTAVIAFILAVPVSYLVGTLVMWAMTKDRPAFWAYARAPFNVKEIATEIIGLHFKPTRHIWNRFALGFAILFAVGFTIYILLTN